MRFAKHIIVAAALASSSAAFAGTTPVNLSTPSDGVSVISILNTTYGGSFSGSASSALSNGTVTATRIDDFVSDALSFGSSPLQLGTGVGSSDQVWVDGTVSFVAEARFAAYTQYFGYRNNTSAGTGATAGVAIGGSGYAVTGSGAWNVGPTGFQWLRAGNASFTDDANNGKVYSSIADNNDDKTDHMITYKITGMGNLRYLLCWEDLPLSGAHPGDYDYNDLVVEVQTVAIPLPTTAGMAGLGIMGLAARRRRR